MRFPSLRLFRVGIGECLKRTCIRLNMPKTVGMARAAKRMLNDDRIVDRIAELMKAVLAVRYPQMFIRERVRRVKSAEPIAFAAPADRSIIRPSTKGPRSTMVTVTDRPLARFRTLIRLPNGNVRCAATRSWQVTFRALAVCLRSQ